MSGWIKLHRKILKNDMWNDVTKFRLFMFLLLNAAHSDGVKVKGIELKRGQYIRAYSKLTEDLGYKEGRGINKVSKSTISRNANKLVEDGVVSISETEHGTLFTILNYAEYQGFSMDDKTERGTTNEPNAERTRNAEPDLAEQEQELKDLRIKELKDIYRQFNHLSMTTTEFERLLSEGYSKESIDDILDQIENYKKNKNYTSLLLTARNWLKNEAKKQLEKKGGRDNGSNVTPFRVRNKAPDKAVSAGYAEQDLEQFIRR